jgi:myo-inositol-1(or 4)-monophosphatase
VPITVRALANLDEAVVATDFGHDRAFRIEQAALLGRVAAEVRVTRNAGSTVLHLAWVAAGRLDAMYQTTTKWWDLAAGGLCVTEAGGVLSDMGGGPVRPESMVASTPGIHGALLGLLDRAPGLQ